MRPLLEFPKIHPDGIFEHEKEQPFLNQKWRTVMQFYPDGSSSYFVWSSMGGEFFTHGVFLKTWVEICSTCYFDLHPSIYHKKSSSFTYIWRGTQTSSSSSRDPNNVMRLTHLESQPKIPFLQTKESQTALQFKSHRLHRQSTKGRWPQKISNWRCWCQRNQPSLRTNHSLTYSRFLGIVSWWLQTKQHLK